jgi:dolichol kinase
LGLLAFDLKAKGKTLPLIDKALSFFERPNEPAGFGALAYFAGILACLTLFEAPLSISILFILAISDGVSTIIGKKFGHHSLPFNKKKTFEGSLAFFASALLIVPFGGIPALVAAIFATIIESLPLPLDDNLTIPLAGIFAVLI